MKGKIGKYKYPLIAFCVALLPRLILCIQAYPLRTSLDETATLSAAAYMAGLNWQGVIPSTNYYGTGFFIILAPFFRLIENPIILYRTVLSVCAVIQSISSLIAYYLAYHFFEIKNKRICTLLGIIASYTVYTRAMVAYNEHILILLTWLIVLVISKLYENIDDHKKKMLYTILLMLVLAYSLTVHTRAVIYWGAVAVAIIGFGIITHRCLISVPTCISVGIVGFTASKLYINYMKAHIWLKGAGEGLKNSSISIVDKNTSLVSIDSWHAWINTIIGQVNTITICTGGLILLFFIIFIKIFFKVIVDKYVKKRPHHDMLEEKVLIIAILCGSAIIATILGQSLSWLGRTTEALSEGFGNSNYGGKAFTYIRYFGPYIGPVIFTGLAYLYKTKKNMNKSFIYTFTGLALVSVFWLTCILPYIYQTRQTGVFEAYLPFSLWSRFEPNRIRTAIPATIILVVIFICIWILQRLQKWNILLIIIALFFSYQYIYDAINYDLVTQRDSNYKTADGSYEFIKNLKGKVTLPDELYVTDYYSKDTYCLYQFLLNRFEICIGEPENSVDEAIVFSNNTTFEYDNFINEGYKSCLLDDNEIVFVKGDKLQKEIQSAGIELKDFTHNYYTKFLRDVDIENGNTREVKESILGEEGYVFKEGNLNLHKGTYKIDLQIDQLEGVEKGWVEIQDKTSGMILNSYVLSSELISKENKYSIAFSIWKDTSVDIKCYRSDNSSLNVNEMVCERIEGTYSQGIMSNEEKEMLVGDIFSNSNSNLFYLAYDRDEEPYLEKEFEQVGIHPIRLEECSSSEEKYIISSLAGGEWMGLLPGYKVIARQGNTILLTNKPDIVGLSEGKEVDLRLWKSDSLSSNNQIQYCWMGPGKYNITVETEVNNTYGTVSASIYWNEYSTGVEGISGDNLEMQVETTEEIRSLVVDVRTENGQIIVPSKVSVEPVAYGKEYIYSKKLLPIVQAMNTYGGIGECLFWERGASTEDRDVVKLLEEEPTIKIEKKIENERKLNDTDADALIIPKSSDIFVFLNKYTVCQKTSSYVLLIKTDLINEGESYLNIYSSHGKLSAQYFEGMEVNLPMGSYLIGVKIYPSMALSDTLDIQIYAGGQKFSSQNIELSEEDKLSGQKYVPVIVSSLYGLSNINVESVQEDGEKIQSEIVDYEKLSDDYQINLSDLYVTNGEARGGVLNLQGDGNAVLSSMYLPSGEYKVIVFAEDAERSKSSISVLAGDTVIGSETINGEKTELSFSLLVEHDDIGLRIEGNGDNIEVNKILVQVPNVDEFINLIS